MKHDHLRMTAAAIAMATIVLASGAARAACGDQGTCTVNGTSYSCDQSCTGSICNDSISHASCDSVCVDGLCVRCIASASATTVNGTSGDDVICTKNGVTGAGNGADVIDAKGDDDIISSGAGDDQIETGAGVNYVHAGSGNDTVDAGTSVDRIWAGDGDDVVNANGGDDEVYGEGGNDTLFGEGGDDLLNAGDPNASGNNYVEGGPGEDTITGESGNDVLLGGPDADWVAGRGGRDNVRGGDGDDTLFSGNPIFTAAPDAYVGSLLCGGDGNDLLYGYGPAHQCMDAGPGQGTPRGSAVIFGTTFTFDCAYGYYVSGGDAATPFDLGTAAHCVQTFGGPTSDDSISCGCEEG